MKFQITQQRPGLNTSVVLEVECERGTPIGAHASTAGAGALANSANFLGFTTRKVQEGGPAILDHILPGGLELPFAKGGQVSLELADEIEVAGDTRVVTSGVGAIDDATAVGTKVSLAEGRFRVKQEADDEVGWVEAQLGADEDGDNVVRIKLSRP